MAYEKDYFLELFENNGQYGMSLSYTQSEYNRQKLQEMIDLPIGTKVYFSPKRQKEGDQWKKWVASAKKTAPRQTYPALGSIFPNPDGFPF